AQPGRPEPAQQLLLGHLAGTAGDQVRATPLRDVVVVVVEGPGGQPGGLGEGMQLVEAGVGDQVGEPGAVRRPARRVDQDGQAQRPGLANRPTNPASASTWKPAVSRAAARGAPSGTS